MFTPKREAGVWTDNHQFLYSLLWSSFLDLDAYSASRFRRRFFPYSTEFVVRELLWNDVPEVQTLGIGHAASRLADRSDTLALAAPFRQLALWTVVPRLFDAPGNAGRIAGRAIRQPDDDFERVAVPLRKIVARQIRAELDIDVASFRFDADARPLVPPGLGLGIEDANISVVAGRRRATATLSAEVFVQYHGDARVAAVVDPSAWETFDYWRPPAEAGKSKNAGTLDMELVLPGGNSASEAKWRRLKMEYAKTSGPFGARLDYDCREADQVPPDAAKIDVAAADFESRRAGMSPDYRDNAEYTHYTTPYNDAATHIQRLRGYLRVEKVAGRPGWTRFEAKREVRFVSPNHDRFRTETLIFWLACDLLSFAVACADGKDAHA